MIERNKILFISFIAGLSVMTFFLFVLFILNILSNKWGSQSDILIAFFTGISTIAIVLTAYWAKKSFWYTDRKDKIERTLKYIEKYGSSDLREDVNFIVNELSITSFQDTTLEVPNKVNNVMTFFEQIGLLLRRDSVDFTLLYDHLYLIVHDIFPILKPYIKKCQERRQRSWEDLTYLYNRFNDYKP